MSQIDSILESLVTYFFEALESSDERKTRFLAVVGGLVVTIAMWLVHLSHPFLLFSSHRTISKVVIVFLLAPPFATAVSVGYLLFPEVNKPIERATGPMSGYLQKERADRRWKIIIVAGMVSAINLLLMMLTSSGA